MIQKNPHSARGTNDVVAAEFIPWETNDVVAAEFIPWKRKME
ncbi:hypothetical protein [Dyadobacter frigoris]|nr:hypothetical protein [Dyadobacter frigoris]